MAEPVEFEIKVLGGEQARREVQKFVDQLNRAGADAKGAARGFALFGDAGKESGRKLGLTVNQLTEFGLGVGTLNPKLRELSIQLASAGNSAVTMGASMGPIGVAIALVVSVLPGMIKLLRDSEEDTEAAAFAMRDYTQSLNDAAAGIRDFIRAVEQQRRVSQGLGDTFQTEARLTELANTRFDIEQRIARIRRESASEQVAASQIRAFGLEQQLAEVAREQETLATVQSFRARGLAEEATEGAGRAPRGDRPSRTRSARPDREAERDRENAERAARRQQIQQQMRDAGVSRIQSPEVLHETIDLDAELAQQQADADKARIERERAYRAEVERANNAWEYRLEMLQQEAEARQAAIRDASDIAEGALELFGASQGQMELMRGLSQVAQAVGSYPDVVGIAQHGISAALHFKNAATLGAGGGGGGGASAGAGGGPSRRPLPTGGGGGGGGPTAVTVNINAPTDEAQLGRMIDRSSRAARRRFG